MTAPYRPAPCASCDALRAEVSALRAKPARVPMRYELRAGGAFFAVTNVCNTLVVALDYADGTRGAWPIARAVWCVVVWAVWALAFVRRVPAEGARS